ncbi:hypothetical protein K435DRAFT_864268 [Dendrothele bispora CBS 962.96]|uniref:Uncharacterized protein n=1 Tax=Dendrothele bispora (strain CBS 962.96) TaxID=1314807 RepID=A0A4S8LMH0_DENBC|nr:hypothetical protein K435DRAFT_864268 [Dendrothele bispora CBS 962.96]
MAPPRTLTCVIVNLTDNWSVLTAVRFARTYSHAYTMDDLLLDEWFPPSSGSLLRRGLTDRQFFYASLSLQNGVTVVIKHEGYGESMCVLEDCVKGDVDIIQGVVMNFRGSNLVPIGRLKRFSSRFIDRRFAAGRRDNLRVGSRISILPTTSCHCGFCLVPNEIFHLVFDSSDMTTLVNFSATSWSHYNRIVIVVDYRSTNAIIHSLAALLPLLSDDTAVPDNIFIATPLSTRKIWVDLFSRIPHLPRYHFWDNNVTVGSMQLVKTRSVFFLPNDVVVTVQESQFDSAMPVLLSHSITAMCCGISYGTIFTLYPQHVKNRITDRLFDRIQPPRWYMNSLTRSIRFAPECYSDIYYYNPRKTGYIEPDCALVWRRTSGCHNMDKCSSLTSNTNFVVMAVQSFSICGMIEDMSLNDRGPNSLCDGSALYVLQLSPDPKDRTAFIDMLRALETTIHDPLLPPTWSLTSPDGRSPYILILYHPSLTAISTAEEVVIQPPPSPEFSDFAVLYKHWNDKRKTVTPGSYVVVDFHVIYQQSHNSMIYPLVVADHVTVLENGIPWFYLRESEDSNCTRLSVAYNV